MTRNQILPLFKGELVVVRDFFALCNALKGEEADVLLTVLVKEVGGTRGLGGEGKTRNFDEEYWRKGTKHESNTIGNF